MSELIRNLEAALSEIASFGSDKAVTIIENAIKQANRIKRSQAKPSS